MDWAPLMVAAAGGAAAAFFAQLIPAFRWMRRERTATHLQQIDWEGRPARRDSSGNIIAPAVPGVMAQITTVRDKLDEVVRKLDEVGNRFDTQLRMLAWDVERNTERLSTLQQVMDGHIGAHLEAVAHPTRPRAGPPSK